jgi:hypothetical protein
MVVVAVHGQFLQEQVILDLKCGAAVAAEQAGVAVNKDVQAAQVHMQLKHYLDQKLFQVVYIQFVEQDQHNKQTLVAGFQETLLMLLDLI